MKTAALFASAALGVLLIGASPGPSRAADPAEYGPPSASATQSDVDAEAVAALDRMGAYLRGLQSFEIQVQTTRDDVMDDGRKLQFTGLTTYTVRRPDRFVISMAEDRKVRSLYYDGKSLTVFAPRMGFYAKVAAPATIRETLDLQAKYGIVPPLVDLFRWGSPDDRLSDLTDGYYVGHAKIDGQDTDQYAFSEEGVDWQIWIARGDKPLPLKVAITSLDDPAQPEFGAILTWNVNPTVADAVFAFRPPADAKPIKIGLADPQP